MAVAEAPTFEEMMKVDTPLSRVLVQLLATVSGSPAYEHLTPQEIYDHHVTVAVEISQGKLTRELTPIPA